ncbi:helix-turn-helix domain-containing protein [Brevibacillus choshinensis]|uniref:helix-turn-helix domain-containing protein n=1 Tax=Brevibacillus choshinensis TaxID=54911 RepID=UPI002E1CEB6A|nr:helix-turn-helix domain-containing protein [Brevibacillus choshinensis]MED4783575.1 helix-turn-helix domain-containing protein [Brevibacillus choshinensis]
MGNIRRTFTVEEKLRAVQLCLQGEQSTSSVAQSLGISRSMVTRWTRHYEAEGVQGLEEKRGKAKGLNKGRPRVKPLSLEEEVIRLRAVFQSF